MSIVFRNVNITANMDQAPADDRADPTDEEMDMVRGRIIARQERIDSA